MKHFEHGGFTLIELMIALAIFAFLIAIAGPQYASFLGNMQIRNGGENTLAGLRLAQVEAVRGNLQGKFVLDPTLGTGGWTVWTYNGGDGIAGNPSCTATGTPQWCLVQSYSWADGAAKTTVTATPPGATEVVFNGLGQIVSNNSALVDSDATATITQIDITNSNVSNPRPLRVAIKPATSSGVTIKLCDPDPGVASNDPHDPRICPS